MLQTGRELRCVSARARREDRLDQILGGTGAIGSRGLIVEGPASQAHGGLVGGDVATAVRTPSQVSFEPLAHIAGESSIEVIENETRKLPARHNGPPKMKSHGSAGL